MLETWEVREAYKRGMHPYLPDGTYITQQMAEKRFDEWLAEVIAAAEERGFGEGYEQGSRDALGGSDW